MSNYNRKARTYNRASARLRSARQKDNLSHLPKLLALMSLFLVAIQLGVPMLEPAKANADSLIKAPVSGSTQAAATTLSNEDNMPLTYTELLVPLKEMSEKN